MSRKRFPTSPLALAVALSLGSSCALALGVGTLRVQSALNQPFAGEIDLLDVKPDELDGVKARIASQEEFARVGAERYHYLTKLRLTPQLSARGKPVIQVSSREPIREPYMDFLVEVQWAGGKTVREFTVLLDPPSTSGRGSRRAEAPLPPSPPREGLAAAVAATAERAPAGQPLPASPPRESARAVIPAAAVGEGFPKYIGPVRPGTGLWRLATRNAPQGATVAQTAMALYRNNQGAFIGGNINRLVAGKTLVIPSVGELFALEPDAAQREFMAALRGNPVRSSPIVQTEGAGEGQAHLRIAGSTPPPATPGTPGLGGEGLERELLLTRETSESARQETQELRGRIRELETQLGDIQKLLQLRNAELARAQQGPVAAPGQGAAQGPGEAIVATPPEGGEAAATGAAPTSTEPSIGEPGRAPEPAGPAPGEPGAGPVTEVRPPAAVQTSGPATPAESTGTATAPAATPGGHSPGPAQAPSGDKKPAVPPPVPSVAPPPQELAGESLWQALLLPLAGIALVAALGIGALAWWRARSRRSDHEGDAFADLDFGETEDSLSVSVPAPSELEPGQPRAAAGASVLQRGAAAAGGAAGSGAAGASTAAGGAKRDLESEEADAISEADIYIAYGRYREAADLLREEVERAPSRIDIKLKLAEAYLGARNRAGLRPLMQDLETSGADRVAPEEWKRLVEMSGALLAAESEEPPADLKPAPPTAPHASSSRAAPVTPAVEARRIDSEDLESDDVFSLDISDMDMGSDLLEPSEDLAAPKSASAGDAAEPASPPAASATRPALGAAPAEAGPPTVPKLPDVAPLGELDDFLAKGADAPGPLPDLVVPLEEPTAPGETRPALRLAEAPGFAGDRGLDLPELPQTTTSLELSSEDTTSGGLPDLLGGDTDPGSSDLLSQWQVDSGHWDETGTKLELARAYLEMSDKESARGILEEVVKEGNEAQRAEANELLRRLG